MRIERARRPRASSGRVGFLLSRVRSMIVLVALVATFVGCVNREKRDVEAARQALDACEVEFGPGDKRCDEARGRLLDAQSRYDDQARRAWSCDPTQDLCPTPR